MIMVNAIIIDDERNSRDIIALMLDRYCPHVTIVAMASDCAEGIRLIRELRPQLVFLDLEMPDGTGFDILTGTQSEVNFEAVFVTAFEKKFLHVIRFSEIELILKPIDKESLLQAVQVTTSRISAGSGHERYQILLDNFNSGQSNGWKILIPVTNGNDTTIFLSDVSYLESDTEGSIFHLTDGSMLRGLRPFRFYTDLLHTLQFYQVNNTQLVQLSAISRVVADSGKVMLKTGSLLDITERRKKDLLIRLEESRTN